MTDDDISGIAKLTNLSVLKLSGTRITDGGLATLSSLISLRVLWLDNTAVTDAGLPGNTPPNLTKVYLRNTATSERGIRQLRERLPKCRIITDLTKGEGFLEKRERTKLDLAVVGKA